MKNFDVTIRVGASYDDVQIHSRKDQKPAVFDRSKMTKKKKYLLRRSIVQTFKEERA